LELFSVTMPSRRSPVGGEEKGEKREARERERRQRGRRGKRDVREKYTRAKEMRGSESTKDGPRANGYWAVRESDPQQRQTTTRPKRLE
jgi:hypothetical protein